MLNKDGILYEYEEGETVNARRKAFHLAVFGAITAGILLWGLWALFSRAAEVGLRGAWSAHSGGMFAVFVILVIFGMSVLPYVKRLQKKRAKNKLTVYRDKIVIKQETTSVIKREDIALIRLDKRHAGCIPSFGCADGKTLYTGILLPPAAVLFLKKEFGARVVISRAEKEKLPFTLPVLLIAALVVCVGIILIAVNGATGVPPVFLGIFFTGGGCVFACIAFERAVLSKEFFLPLCVGAVFFWAPTGLAAAFAEVAGEAFSLAGFFADFSFSAFHCAWVYLTAIGAYFMLGALYGLARFLRYSKLK